MTDTPPQPSDAPATVTAEAEAELGKAARIFIQRTGEAVKGIAAGQPDEVRMQLVASMAVQGMVKAVALHFDPAAKTGLSSELFEAMIHGLGLGVGLSTLGQMDALSREAAFRVFLAAVRDGITHAEASRASASTPKGIILP